MPRDNEAESAGRLGRRMMIAGWVVGLLLLTGVFQRLLDLRDNPNREVVSHIDPQGRGEVLLRRNPAGHYVARGSINDHEVTFLVDTGASDVAVPAGIADRLGLKTEGYGVSRTAPGDVEMERTTLGSVRLGAIELRQVKASILPRMAGDEVLLGMSFLKKLEMVQREDVLTLRQY